MPRARPAAIRPQRLPRDKARERRSIRAAKITGDARSPSRSSTNSRRRRHGRRPREDSRQRCPRRQAHISLNLRARRVAPSRGRAARQRHCGAAIGRSPRKPARRYRFLGRHAKQLKVRLDSLLVSRGLAQSRERASALVLSGVVLVNGQPARKRVEGLTMTSGLEVAGPSLCRSWGIKLRMHSYFRHPSRAARRSTRASPEDHRRPSANAERSRGATTLPPARLGPA